MSSDEEPRGLDLDRRFDPEQIYDPARIDPRLAKTDKQREIMIGYRQQAGLSDYPKTDQPSDLADTPPRD